jgi:hypothetical protein
LQLKQKEQRILNHTSLFKKLLPIGCGQPSNRILLANQKLFDLRYAIQSAGKRAESQPPKHELCLNQKATGTRYEIKRASNRKQPLSNQTHLHKKQGATLSNPKHTNKTKS